jgi:hypothetical protein
MVAVEPEPGAAVDDLTKEVGEPTVVLFRQGKVVSLEPPARRALVAHAEQGLAFCNFTSQTNPNVFGPEDLDALWKQRKTGAHVLIGYGQPKRITAVAGELLLDEVLLALDTQYGPEPALVKSGGSTLGLKKCGWDDRSIGCVAELESVFGRPEFCPPGY